MTASVGFVAIDSTDPVRLAQFWSALLGVPVGETLGVGTFVLLEPTAQGLTIGFQRVPEAKSGKNRVHLDLMVDDLDESTAEIESLGGRWAEPGTTRELEGFFWRFMADPEDNEFDIDHLPAT
jgi:predicted enzyme related to lactoylglutathione lyase